MYLCKALIEFKKVKHKNVKEENENVFMEAVWQANIKQPCRYKKKKMEKKKDN